MEVGEDTGLARLDDSKVDVPALDRRALLSERFDGIGTLDSPASNYFAGGIRSICTFPLTTESY